MGAWGLSDQATLTGQEALGIHLSLPAQCWDYQYMPACLDFVVSSRMELMFLWLYNKHFTNYAVLLTTAATLDLGNLALAQGGEGFILHLLVKTVLRLHCSATPPCFFPDRVKGVSNTKRLML